MLTAIGADRAGSGLWTSSSVLYFTFVAHLSTPQVGLLLGVGGVAGIAGSPLAGMAAARLPVRSLLIGCHLLRLATLTLVLLCTGFDALLPVVAVTCLGDRSAKTLEMLFATRAAGERRSTYQALARSAGNAGFGLGAGVAAVGLAVGSHGAYQALICGDALSFAIAAALVSRTHRRGAAGVVASRSRPETGRPASPRENPPGVRHTSPWRDRGYLLFVLLDIPMNLDDSVIGVGLPLWLVNRTTAPHALVPAFLIMNTAMVVLLQMNVSARYAGPRGATRAVLAYGCTTFGCCVVVAAAPGGGNLVAGAALLAAAFLATAAELMRSVSSWELAVLLAPEDARAEYLGVAGMSQSIQKSVGPPLLTSVVMVAGPAGWVAMGTAVAGLALLQRTACARRLRTLRRPPHDDRPGDDALPASGPRRFGRTGRGLVPPRPPGGLRVRSHDRATRGTHRTDGR
ncbi:MFS transporter [Streptomyces sp. NBC_01497]|uniref:MFS transporter n=1 Tax=Streptomyces sp. NBC_01497 TaxID=2903885 RepID=UPI002E31FA71|nr:MFS transporter [Streptomyces sp. NBC_01497]